MISEDFGIPIKQDIIIHEEIAPNNDLDEPFGESCMVANI
jgi:hypothetical protein